MQYIVQGDVLWELLVFIEESVNSESYGTLWNANSLPFSKELVISFKSYGSSSLLCLYKLDWNVPNVQHNYLVEIYYIKPGNTHHTQKPSF